MNALTTTALLSSAAVSPTSVTEHGMAAVFAQHTHLIALVNGEAGLMEDDPTILAYNEAVETIAAFAPTALSGVVSKARAAMVEACATGKEQPGDGWAPDWAWHIVHDLLRLFDRPSPDAPLIALCEEFIALEHRLTATNFEAEPGTPESLKTAREQGRIVKAQEILAKRLEKIESATLSGHRAKARCLLAWAPDILTNQLLGGTGDRLLKSLLRGLMQAEQGGGA